MGADCSRTTGLNDPALASPGLLRLMAEQKAEGESLRAFFDTVQEQAAEYRKQSAESNVFFLTIQANFYHYASLLPSLFGESESESAGVLSGRHYKEALDVAQDTLSCSSPHLFDAVWKYSVYLETVGERRDLALLVVAQALAAWEAASREGFCPEENDKLSGSCLWTMKKRCFALMAKKQRVTGDFEELQEGGSASWPELEDQQRQCSNFVATGLR